MTPEIAARVSAAWIAAASLILFIAMGLDKLRAKRGAWRIPERTLFWLAALGGGIGGVIGMSVFHHKTKHNSFKVGFPLLTVLNLAVAAAVIFLAANG